MELVQYAVNLHVQAHRKGETITKTPAGSDKVSSCEVVVK